MHLPAVHNIQPITLGLGLKTPKQSVLFIRPFQCLLVLMGCRTVVCWETRSFKSLSVLGGLDVLNDTKQKCYSLSFIHSAGPQCFGRQRLGIQSVCLSQHVFLTLLDHGGMKLLSLGMKTLPGIMYSENMFLLAGPLFSQVSVYVSYGS